MTLRYRFEFEDHNGNKCQVWFDASAFWVLYPDLLRREMCGDIGNVKIFGASGFELVSKICEPQPASIDPQPTIIHGPAPDIAA